MSGSNDDVKSNVSKANSIPAKRVLVNSPSQLPADYSTTPGGTLFSTTPGGTRLIYERNFLLKCRNSPLTKSPPKIINEIPGVTCSGDAEEVKENCVSNSGHQLTKGEVSDDQPQFQLDI